MPAIPVTGNTGKTAPENRAFYPALDGFRAVAFLLVFFGHYDRLPWGSAGVDLFFVLSGFLITGILFDTRDDPHRVRNFYVRRMLRIFPLYYGIMLALLAAAPFSHWQWNWHWLAWPLYLGNLAGNFMPFQAGSPLQRLFQFQLYGKIHGHVVVLYLGHFWSLCVEEQFYLVWPWIVFSVRDRRKLLWICGASLPLTLGLRLLCEHLLPAWMLSTSLLYRSTPFRVDALLLGGLLALLLRGPHAGKILRTSRFALPVAIAALALAAWRTPYHHLFTRPYPDPAARLTYGLTIIDLLAALLILVSLQPGSILYRVLSVQPLRWLGRITYGAYVVHDIPHHFFRSMGQRFLPSHSEAATSAIALVTTLLLAWLSFKYFESPFLNLKERWTRKDRPLDTMRSPRKNFAQAI